MTKKQTGRSFSPEEFRALPKCLGCGIVLAQEIPYCEECHKQEVIKCEMCEAVLREGQWKAYAYDIKEVYRDNKDLKVSKERVIEFFYYTESMAVKAEDGLCTGCVDWKTRMKNICFLCDNDFENTKENYKLNGNMCEFCSPQFELDA